MAKKQKVHRLTDEEYEAYLKSLASPIHINHNNVYYE